MDLLPCSKCELLLPTDHFTPRPDRKRGYHSRCHACQRTATNQRRAENPEHYLEYTRNYNATNAEHITEVRHKRKPLGRVPRFDDLGNVWCSACTQYLPRVLFGDNLKNTYGLNAQCNLCLAAYARENRAANPGRHATNIRNRQERIKAIPLDERTIPRLKRCIRCQLVKRIVEFGVLLRNPDGRQGQCFECYNITHRTTPPKPRAYWMAGSDGLEPAALCSACQRIVPLYDCRSDPRGYKRAMMRCVTCRTKARTAWRQKNIIKDRLSQHRTRIKNRPHRYGSIIEVVTDADIEDIWARFNYACAYCENADAPLTIDHLIPVADGGAHSKENLVPACLSCNSRKRTLSVDEFLRRNPHRKDPRLRK